jgi:serine/threonine-protein kinase
VIESPVILNRYQIIKLLAESQNRRTYLAKDNYRFDELCVIKELVESEKLLDDAKTQFKQETQILYQLNHPQIPRFRETFLVENAEQKGLYYVRDYIPGFTYRELFKLYQSQQKYFSETDIIDLLKQLLPVVDYLHSLGVYHQDISLDNLICRKWDQLPFLIDFSQVQTLENASLSPSPQQDLSQIAIALLSLLTLKESSQLFEGETRSLREEIILSPKLKRVFSKMVTDLVNDRFTTAQDVIAFLNQPDLIENQPTINLFPSPPPNLTVSTPPEKETMVTLSRKKQSRFLGCLSQLGLILAVSIGSGAIGWFVGKTWLKPPLPPKLTFEKTDPSTFSDPALFPVSTEQAVEWERKAELRKRRQELGINNQFFQMLVDQIFLSRYPDDASKTTSSDPVEKKEWQKKRDEIASELINQLSSLSEEARGELGSYDRLRRQELIKEANELNLSSRALYDLANAEFYREFPDEDKDNMEQPTGQILSAMLLDSLRRLQSEEAYEKLELPLENEISRQGTLESGKGKAYVIQLEGSQEVEFQISAPQETQLSIYSPSGRSNLIEDSTETSWTGTLPESGLYEITVVSKSDTVFDYQLNIRVLSNSFNQ